MIDLEQEATTCGYYLFVLLCIVPRTISCSVESQLVHDLWFALSLRAAWWTLEVQSVAVVLWHGVNPLYKLFNFVSANSSVACYHGFHWIKFFVNVQLFSQCYLIINNRFDFVFETTVWLHSYCLSKHELKPKVNIGIVTAEPQKKMQNWSCAIYSCQRLYGCYYSCYIIDALISQGVMKMISNYMDYQCLCGCNFLRLKLLEIFSNYDNISFETARWLFPLTSNPNFRTILVSIDSVKNGNQT